MPTKSPETMMIMSDRTPVKYTSRITSRKRLKLVPEEASTRPKKRAIEPARHTPFTKLFPSRMSGLRTSSMRASEAHILRVGRGRVVERDRPVALAVDELAYVRMLRGSHLVRRALAQDCAVGDEIEVVDDVQRLDHVVRHHDRSGAERVVQLANQLSDHRERDRVQPR